MKHISSKENTQYKQLLKTHLGKTKGEVLLEGVHLCRSWLECYGEPVLAIFNQDILAAGDVRQNTGVTDPVYTSDHSKKKHGLFQSVRDEINQMLVQLDKHKCLSVPGQLFQQLSDVDSPQGILFLVKVPVQETRTEISENAIFLDRLQDPGNAGTILRSAAAAGVRDVYLSKNSVSAWSAKVLRSAQGAHFSLNIYEQQDLSALIDKARIPVMATALSDTAVNLFETRLPEKCIWLMGHEGQGVHPDLLSKATTLVFIPQTSLVESLNVGVAAGIVLFEHRRQRLYLAQPD